MFSNISIKQEAPDGTLSIRLNYVSETTRYAVYSVKDQKLLEKKLVTTEVRVNHKLPEGTYFVKVMENNIISCTQKITVTEPAKV